MLHNLLNHNSTPMDAGQFDQIWNSVGMKSNIAVQSASLSNEASLVSVLGANGFKSLGKGPTGASRFSAMTINNIPVVAQATALPGNVSVEVCSPVPPLEGLIREMVNHVLTKNA